MKITSENVKNNGKEIEKLRETNRTIISKIQDLLIGLPNGQCRAILDHVKMYVAVSGDESEFSKVDENFIATYYGSHTQYEP